MYFHRNGVGKYLDSPIRKWMESMIDLKPACENHVFITTNDFFFFFCISKKQAFPCWCNLQLNSICEMEHHAAAFHENVFWQTFSSMFNHLNFSHVEIEAAVQLLGTNMVHTSTLFIYYAKWWLGWGKGQKRPFTSDFSSCAYSKFKYGKNIIVVLPLFSRCFDWLWQSSGWNPSTYQEKCEYVFTS